MSRRKNIALAALVIFLGVIAGVSIPVYNAYQAYRILTGALAENKPETPQRPQPVQEQPKLLQEQYYSIMIYGVDAGEWVNDTYRPGAARADTIILARVDLENKKAYMLSIPRDTLVTIPGRGEDKINHAHSFGGANLLVDTVEQFTGITVDYYLQVNYRLFRDIVNSMGGIHFDVDNAIASRSRRFDAGPQLLDGDQAFKLISFRSEPMGDIARVERQQRFVGAIARQVRTTQPRQLVRMVFSSWRNVKTNLAMEEAAELITALRGIEEEQVEKAVVPGWFYNRGGVSYWRANEQETQLIIDNLFAKQEDTET